MTYDWSKMVKMTVPVGLCGWQQRGSLTINGRTTEFPVGVETELPEPVAERVKAMMADAEEKAEHVQPLKPWMQYVTGADGVAHWSDRIDKPGAPHQYLTTDGNGKPHWVDKLAYEMVETVHVVTIKNFEYGSGTVKEAAYIMDDGPIVIGDKYRIVYNGAEYECIAQSGSGNKPFALGNVDGTADGEPFLLKFSAGSQLSEGYQCRISVNCVHEWFTKPVDPFDITITKLVPKVKTIDPDKMGKNAGANKVLVTDGNGEAVWSDGLAGGAGGGVIYVDRLEEAQENPKTCYVDRELTQPMDYATGKAILLSGGWMGAPNEIDGFMFELHLKPVSLFSLDEVNAAQVTVLNPNVAELTAYNMTLAFSDSIMD